MSSVLSIMSAAEAWDDYVYRQGQDKKTLRCINQLIKNVQRSPFEGIGRAEPLKENLTGFGSRRIDETNRLVYEVANTQINFVPLHY